ncbi:MAG TPA: hypothetical protein VK644_04450 [Chitinophagaceae bacterium]|nr:hypothetical protein [Chitinophagaceae bacterium]
MANDQPPPTQALPPTPTPPTPKPPNKWLRLGRKILIGALITWVVNFLLLKTGWDSWETFSKKADSFSGSMMDGALRLSPLNLWNSIKSDQKTYVLDNSESRYIGTYRETGTVSLKDKILTWLGYYWYTESGKAFWVGRLIMIIALIVGIGIAVEKYSDKDGFIEKIVFPINALFRTMVFLLGLGFFALALYVLMKILLAVVGGLVIIFSTLATGGGIVKLLLEEAKNEAAEGSKKTIAASVLPLFIGKLWKK